jgi:dTDP-4-dehydrorhamnose 3,5-epimerase-like enzyme
MLVKTPIAGLEIELNKVVKDPRGILCELAPGGFENVHMKSHGIRNAYATFALDKSPRAGHYHHRNIEHFYTLGGTGLWLFKDYRKDSKTYGKTYAVIAGFEKAELDDVHSFTIEESKMAQLIVPAGVYHVVIPITDKPCLVVALCSEPYDAADYEKILPEDIEEFKPLLDAAKRKS